MSRNLSSITDTTRGLNYGRFHVIYFKNTCYMELWSFIQTSVLCCNGYRVAETQKHGGNVVGPATQTASKRPANSPARTHRSLCQRVSLVIAEDKQTQQQSRDRQHVGDNDNMCRTVIARSSCHVVRHQRQQQQQHNSGYSVVWH